MDYCNSDSFENYITYDNDGGDDCKGCKCLSECRNGTRTCCVWNETVELHNPYLENWR